MATGGYVGNNNVARKIVGGYVGVNNLARKIIKGYVGVNGTAHLMYDMSKKKGYTFEDFLDYCEYIKPIIAEDLGTSSEQYIMCSRIVDNKDTIVQIGNQLNLSQYDGFFASGIHSTHYIRFWATKNVQSLSINQNGSANVGQSIGQFCANYNANKSNWLARRNSTKF